MLDLGNAAANEAMGYLVKALSKPDDGKRDTVEQCGIAVMRALFDTWARGDTIAGRELNALFQAAKNRSDPLYLSMDAMMREGLIMSLITLESTKEQLANVKKPA